jgi:hypothetical protein
MNRLNILWKKMKIRLLLSTTPPMLRILLEEKNENKDSSAMPLPAGTL